MPSKTKNKSKTKNIINSKYKKLKIKNKNVVNVHIHKTKRAPVINNPVKTVVRDTFQPRLPMYHPFVNAPVPPTPLQSPVNVHVHGAALTNNTPSTSALHTHIQSAQSGTQAPVTSPDPYNLSALQNPLFSPDLSTPLRPKPRKPESVNPSSSNRYDVLSDNETSYVNDEIAKIASEVQETPTEVRDKFEHWNIIHNGRFTKKAAANRETDWTIDTFIRHNLPFLYKQGIFLTDEPAPSKTEVKTRLHEYIRDHDLFDTPHHSGTNRLKQNWSLLYKKLDENIRAGTAPHVQQSPVLNEEQSLEESKTEYLFSLAKKRKLKLDKKWEVVDKRNGLPLRERKHEEYRNYLLHRLRAKEKFIKKN